VTPQDLVRVMTEDRENTPEINDLFEFYRQWPGLRTAMVSLAAAERLTASERMILTSMIAIVDRVGPNDLHPGTES